MDSSWLFNLGADVYAWFTAQGTWRSSAAELATPLQDLAEPSLPAQRVAPVAGVARAERVAPAELVAPAERVAPTRGRRGVVFVADLGCGPGVSTFELARRLPAARLLGVDIAPRMLAQARHRRGAIGAIAGPLSRITWLQADAARLPLASASLEACTGHSFLYLVADRTAVLAEIRRVLKPGGRLVLMEPNDRPTSIARALNISRDPRHLVSVSLWRPFSRLHGRFTPATLKETLQQAGFVNCQITETLAGLGLLISAIKSENAI